jgi:hypothetical protein
MFINQCDSNVEIIYESVELKKYILIDDLNFLNYFLNIDKSNNNSRKVDLKKRLNEFLYYI